MPLSDEPRFAPAGDFRSVDGMLVALQITALKPADQRDRIADLLRLESMRPVLEPLLPELKRRGLA